jgi:hypothetical protein
MNPFHSLLEPPDEGPLLPLLSASFSAFSLPSATTGVQSACQSQRRSDYQGQKIASDPVYQQVCLESPRKWRRANPDYWKKYRQAHPEQVERNCRKQRCRDQKRRLVNLANNNLATCKALSFQSLDSSGVASFASCKQHPFEIAPSAGL